VGEYILFRQRHGMLHQGPRPVRSLYDIAGVSVIVDACGHWDPGTADLALRQITAKGARATTVDELVHRSRGQAAIPLRADHRRASQRAVCHRRNGRVSTRNTQAPPPLSPSSVIMTLSAAAHGLKRTQKTPCCAADDTPYA